MVEHEKNGWLAAESDDQGLTRGLELAFNESATLSSWGQRARHTVLESFTEKLSINRYSDLYRRIIGESATPGGVLP